MNGKFVVYLNLLVFLFFIGFAVSQPATEEQCEMTEEGFCKLQAEPSGGGRVAKGSNERGLPPEAKKDCVDRYPKECPNYAGNGECERNPGWMIVNCASSCSACHLRDPKVRCNRSHLNISTEPIYRPGDMNDMFSSIVRDFPQYTPTVISTSPWVVEFHDFIADEEIYAILDSVHNNWERSTDTGKMNEFGETGRTLSTSRTSNNAWCRRECEENELVQNVMKKIEQVTRIPKTHFESFQILRYEVGQYYRTHNDMGPRQVQLSCGPRILTFFLYLSDVQEGGETVFPNLNIAVKPKKGNAILWPSTMNDNLEQQDPRTNHEARPVVRGIKYGANAWIHLYDFEKSNLWGCTGTFDYL